MWINHCQCLPQGTSARECGEHEVQIASTADYFEEFLHKGEQRNEAGDEWGVKRGLCKDGKN